MAHTLIALSIFATSAAALAQGGSWIPHSTTQMGGTDSFGCSAAVIGDINGDGYSDWLVGAQGFAGALGAARVYSGIDGGLLYKYEGEFAPAGFGTAVCATGDLNGDGIPDFAVSAPSFNSVGEVRAYSGATGIELWQSVDGSGSLTFGNALAGGDDVSGDGIPDILVGDPLGDTHGAFQGLVHVMSGADGTILYHLGGTLFSNFGHTIDFLDDVNADGIADIIVGAPEMGNGDLKGEVYVYAGGPTAGALLYSISNYGAGNIWRVGRVVQSLGDIDKDGVGDFAVVNQERIVGGYGPGRLDFYSGVSGQVIQQVLPPFGWSWYASESIAPRSLITGGKGVDVLLCMYPLDFTEPALISVGPSTGYLVKEIPLQGTPNLEFAALAAGRHAASGLEFFAVGEPMLSQLSTYLRDAWLSATSLEISVSSGALTQFHFDFPSDAAFDHYQVLVSSTGANRTALPNGVNVNLTVDSILAQTFLGQYPGVIQNPTGTLTATGSGDFSLNLPPNALNPGLVGSHFYVAVVCQPGAFQYRYATESLAISVIP